MAISTSYGLEVMDIRRTRSEQRLRQRWLGIAAFLILVVLLLTYAASLAQRPTSIETDSIWFGDVVRGPLVDEVTASGRLVAPDIRAVSNRTEGVVEQVHVLAGARIDADTVLVTLVAPALEEELAEARWRLEEIEAETALERIESENRLLDLEAEVASANAEFISTQLELDAQERLGEGQVYSTLEVERTRLKADQLQKRLEAKQSRLERYASVQEAEREAAAARLATQRDRVARLERQKLGLEVRAGVVGTVLEIDAEEGERLGAGSALARIVDTSHLIARVGVSERDAGRLDIGLPARVEVGRSVIQARIERIDPGVRNRLVDVDLALEEPLPEGLRPDLSVASRIEIDRIEDALKLPRPALLEDGSERFTVFRLTEDEDRAMRTQLQLGRRSAREVEVLAGLAEGDRVILADMSDWLDHDELRLQ